MYLKNPSLFTRLGGKLPRGLMLTGPPGTGEAEVKPPFVKCIVPFAIIVSTMLVDGCPIVLPSGLQLVVD